MTAAAVAKKKLLAKVKPKPENKVKLSSGLTLLNKAISGRTSWAFRGGHVYVFVGDSAAGKSFLMKQVFAEAANNPVFDKYRLEEDNPERGDLMDVPKFFGRRVSERLKAPKDQGHSRSLEEYYDNISDLIRAGKPFISGLDSEDALESEVTLKKAEADKKARRKERKPGDKEEETKGSYGMAKPKLNSQGLRSAHRDLDKTGSMLFMIKQTRDNIGPTAFFNPKTRSGGHALTFYASVELWFSIAGKIKKTVRGKTRVIGSLLKIHVKKNRMSGRDRAVVVPFYPATGFDEVGSMVLWLCEEGHWPCSKDTTGKITKVSAPEFQVWDETTEALIKKIEDEGKEKELRFLVSTVWDDIEDACTLPRKMRYA